jgi:hypothetical protein
VGFLDAMVRWLLTTRGPYLDCGSGISTVILAALAERVGDTVWSLEQDEQWSAEMRKQLESLRLSNVQLMYAPLEIVGNAAWYGINRDDFPKEFPLVLCDGPAVRRSLWPPEVFQSWRVGVVHALRSRGVRFTSIVLDDADDRRCEGLIDTWRSNGLIVEVVDTPTGRHVVARNESPSNHSAFADAVA